MVSPLALHQKDGCSDRNCPLLHDRDAVLANRSRVLENRRKTFHHKQRPSYRQCLLRSVYLLQCVAENDEALEAKFPQSEQCREIFRGNGSYCANPQCMKPWRKADDKNPLISLRRLQIYSILLSECVMIKVYRHSYTFISAKMPEGRLATMNRIHARRWRR